MTKTKTGKGKGKGRDAGATGGDDRPVRYIDTDADGNDVVVYRASGLASCDRVFVAYANGHTPAPLPEFMAEVFAEGHRWETAIIEGYEAECGVKTFDHQREVVLDLGTIRGSHVIIRGHIDGLSTDGQATWVFDAKKIRDSGWADFMRRGIEMQANYPWQMSVYFHALVAEGVDLAGWDLVGGHLEGKGDDAQLVEVRNKTGMDAPLPFKAIRRKVAAIEKLIADGLDVGEVPCNVDQYPCPFYKLHDEKGDLDERAEDADDDEVFAWPEDDGELDALLIGFADASESVRHLTAKLKTAEEAKKAAARGLYAAIEHYEDQGADKASKLVGRGWEVSRTRRDVPEKVVKGYSMDYLQIKQAKGVKEMVDAKNVEIRKGGSGDGDGRGDS